MIGTLKPKANNRWFQGFTLIELLIGMAVLSIAMTALFTFFISQNKVDTTNRRNFTQQQEGMFLMGTLTTDIRRAGYMHTSSGSDQDILIAESDKIKFYVGSNSTVTYEYDSENKKIKQYNSSYPTGRTIYDDLNITSFSFQYYDSDGSELSTPVSSSNLSKIRRINISMELQPDTSADIGGSRLDTIPFSTSVNPRNVGMTEE